MSVEEQKAYLKKEGVYEQLGKIINRVAAEKPKDAYGLIEVLSRLVKEPAKAAEEPIEPELDEHLKVLETSLKKSKLLDKVPASEEGEPVVVPCAVPDFVEESEMFSWAGVGLGEAESYKVMCSMRNMASKLDGFTKIRFWGKVLGTEADYYVIEAAGGDGGDVDENEDMDPPGSGVNAFTYFVTTDLAGAWVKLPHVKPREIVAAKMTKRLVTGNPHAPVITHPFFEGKEEVYLRAQIARISADTVLCVKGVMIREDPEDPASQIVDNAEFTMPAAEELLKKEAWMHMVPHLLNNGRTAHKELPDPEEDAAGHALAKEEQEADPPKDVLRGLDEDGLTWAVKQAGDTALYKSPVDGKPRSNAVTYVRCLSWPGAVTVAQKGCYANLYVGHALKAGEPDFFPPAPPDVQDEPEDPGEVPEPQGVEETPEEPPAEE